jgi:hypothetical protein
MDLESERIVLAEEHLTTSKLRRAYATAYVLAVLMPQVSSSSSTAAPGEDQRVKSMSSADYLALALAEAKSHVGEWLACSQ